MGEAMNILDILPLKKKERPKFDRAKIKEADELEKYRNNLDTIKVKGFVNSDSRKVINNLVEKINAEISDIRVSILQESKTVPASLYRDDYLTDLAKSPRANLSEIRRFADAFGFVIIPFEYMTDRAFDAESGEVERSATNFAVHCRVHLKYQNYVLCPLPYYSLQKHVAAEEDLPIYSGVFEQSFMAVNMTLPVFRQMARQIKTIEAVQKNSELRMDVI
jgi:CRISPR/Cas system endoribonuclease Cas6 (RAMP superfamily)